MEWVENETTLEAVVNDDMIGERLDKVAAQVFEDFSRARLQTWIAEGRLTVNGEIKSGSWRVRGDELLVLLPLPDDHCLAFTPEPVEFSVVAEDEAILVINKPAGLVVHPAAGHWQGTLLNGLLYRYPELAQLPRAGIVHRLDKDTTGLMVVARTLEAQTSLVRQLQARTVSRRYLALCWGAMHEQIIDQPIGRDPRDRLRMAVVASGKHARTHVQVNAVGRLQEHAVSAVHCQLETGRTHQIRVHLAHVGHSLVGDPLYSSRAQKLRHPLTRQALHAWKLGLMHPNTADLVQFHCPLPDDLIELWRDACVPL